MRSWISMQVRLLKEEDVAAATELSAEAGWNQTADDWRMLLRLAPDGCFGMDADGRLVSTATLVCFGRELAWIGMVLTTAAYRRRGFARKLLGHAIERADEIGIESLKLDATDQGQPLYESLGFRMEQPVERWWRAGIRPADLTGPGSLTVDSFAMDREATGVDRSELLDALARRGGVSSEPDGFCLSRPGRRAKYVGPCVARNARLARESIEACANEDSYWDLLPQNRAALDMATGLGFAPARRLVRMVRGRDLRGCEDRISGLAGFEWG
jgi:GNAT superfamily N-acetyltransferase